MALLFGLPSACPSAPWPTFTPSGRYTFTNPPRREAGLRLLTERLPDPLRWTILRAWRGSSRYSRAPLDVPAIFPERPSDVLLFQMSPGSLANAALVELELGRRVVETPQASMPPVTRNARLSEQSVYLRRLYDALARKIGGPAALAQFGYLIAHIV